jgi:alanine racemase
MRPSSVLWIDLAALDSNLSVLRRLVGPGCRLCPIVKADAYGLGARRLARRFTRPTRRGGAAAAEMLAVYAADEALALADRQFGTPILVMQPLRSIEAAPGLVPQLAAGRVHLSVHDRRQLDSLARDAAALRLRLAVHLEVDTGLRRGGLEPGEVPEALAAVGRTAGLRLAGVMTHFSDARSDADLTEAQWLRLESLLQGAELPPEVLVHVSSTYAMLRDRRLHRGMVRFGLAWAGYGSDELPDGVPLPEAASLRPILRWTSETIHAKRIPSGSGVGYGSAWTAPRDSVVGLVPVGYADGFPSPRARGEPPCVMVRRRGTRREASPASVVGAVNMDQITIDLTEFAAARPDEDLLGLEVEILSPDPASPVHLPRVAARSGLIPHELLCRLSPRIPRVHLLPQEAAGARGDTADPPLVETFGGAAAEPTPRRS